MKKLLPFLLLFLFFRVESQVSFRHLGTSEGFTANCGKSLMKDKRGFLWIATESGLCRFDGKNTQIFQHKKSDSSSIANNYVTCICEDQDPSSGRIWIGTKGGLSVFNITSNTFTNYFHLNEKKKDSTFSLRGVKSLAYFKGKLWIGLSHGLIKADVSKLLFSKVSREKLHFSKKEINCLPDAIYTSGNSMWISTFTGLVYTSDGELFYSINHNPNHWKLLDMGFISGLCQVNDSNVWFNQWSTDFFGLYKFNILTGKMDSATCKNVFAGLQICRVSQDILWISTTSQGVIEFNIKTREFKRIASDINDPLSLSSNEVYSVLSDNEGTRFVATARGVDVSNPICNIFKSYYFRPGYPGNLPDENFTNIEEDGKGNLWIGTFSNGVYVVDHNWKVIKHFDFEKLTGYKDYNEIWYIVFNEGMLWISTMGGFMKMDLKTEKIQRDINFPNEVKAVLEDQMDFCYETKNGFYWIGTEHNGLIKYNFKTKDYIWYSTKSKARNLPDNVTRVAVKDSFGNLWVGFNSPDVIVKIDAIDNSVKTFHLLDEAEAASTGWITDMIMYNKDNILISTRLSGLYLFCITKGTFKPFLEERLSNNMILCTVPDKYDNIWICTSTGLNRFNKRTNSVSSYLTSDGLPSDNFEGTTIIHNGSGAITIAFPKSLLRFNPNNVSENPYNPLPVILNYEIAGKKYYLDGKEEKINLSYKDKTINFYFAGINYIDPDKNSFAYFMEGFDKDWTYSDKRSFASYTNLPGGDYVLHLKVRNKDKGWQVKEFLLPVHVEGPFWKTWWFFTLCGLGLAGAMSLAYYIRLRQIIRVQEMRNQISRDLHDEVGSSLSSISIYSEVAKQMIGNSSTEASSVIESLGNSARSAMDNMSDIVWAVNPMNDKFSNIVERIHIFGNQLLGAKNINLHFDIKDSVNEVKLDMQQRKNIYLILKEAMTNVAKYAQAVNCYVEINKSGNFFSIMVKDDGKGISENKENLGGNGLLNMRRRAGELKGILDIQSTTLNGTTLTLQFEL